MGRERRIIKKKKKRKKKIYLIFNFIRDATLFVIIRYNYTKSTEKVKKKKKKRERKIGGPFFFPSQVQQHRRCGEVV